MQKRVLITGLTSVLLLSFVPVLKAAPVAVIKSFEATGLGVSAEKIHKAIGRAAQMRKWGIKSDEPGKVILVYPTNDRALQYQATVSVTYDQDFYKVEYVSSRGLNEKRDGCYGQQGVVCAHRNVNRWIANLGKDLQRLLKD